ncbi:hypothetical protein [Oryza sativa Japonica Group]|uniref:Uncharacterized protein n=1 Tax=Oryza sativa subsp. japonica TaxID=39947 RepID=Q5JLT6_ORYSJ|nr:hypothetical protein [Oryza sativa Japonica Group]
MTTLVKQKRNNFEVSVEQNWISIKGLWAYMDFEILESLHHRNLGRAQYLIKTD